MTTRDQPRRGWLAVGTDIAQIVQALATVVALLAAAWWFRQQREVYPRADISQSIEVLRLNPGIVAVEVHVKFHNAGKQLIELTSATVKLQKVGSEPYDIAALSELQNEEYWTAKRPIPTPDPKHFSQGELRWPILKQFQRNLEHRVEPGETDLIVFSFVIPCTEDVGTGRKRIRSVRVASDIIKPADAEAPAHAWKTRSFADVSSACGH